MVTACVCDAFMVDMLTGRNFSTDTMMMALYLQASATLGPTTPTYTATGEITGTGYVAGGVVLVGFAVGLSGNTAYLTWDSPTWPNSTLTADAAFVYDLTNSNRAVCVLKGNSASSANTTFTVQLPAAGASTTMTAVSSTS